MTVPVPHGTSSGYDYHKCRCELCSNFHRSYQRKWYARPESKALVKSYQNEEKRERNKARCKEWWTTIDPNYARHKWKVARHRQRVNKSIKTRDSKWTATYMSILYKDPCCYCDASMRAIDHIEPISSVGEHHWSNLTSACTKCNRQKSTKRLIYFLAQGAMLYS